MATEINAEANTDVIASALRTASDGLESISAANAGIKTMFENEKWTGLDSVNAATGHIAAVRDKLVVVAEKVGVGGAVVRGAHQQNQMVGTKESVTGY